jgi:hypothetical protein
VMEVVYENGERKFKNEWNFTEKINLLRLTILGT